MYRYLNKLNIITAVYTGYLVFKCNYVVFVYLGYYMRLPFCFLKEAYRHICFFYCSTDRYMLEVTSNFLQP